MLVPPTLPQQMTVPSLRRAQVETPVETSFVVVVRHAAPQVPGGQLHLSIPAPTVIHSPPFSHRGMQAVAGSPSSSKVPLGQVTGPGSSPPWPTLWPPFDSPASPPGPVPPDPPLLPPFPLPPVPLPPVPLPPVPLPPDPPPPVPLPPDPPPPVVPATPASPMVPPRPAVPPVPGAPPAAPSDRQRPVAHVKALPRLLHSAAPLQATSHAAPTAAPLHVARHSAPPARSEQSLALLHGRVHTPQMHSRPPVHAPLHATRNAAGLVAPTGSLCVLSHAPVAMNALTTSNSAAFPFTMARSLANSRRYHTTATRLCPAMRRSGEINVIAERAGPCSAAVPPSAGEQVQHRHVG